MEERISSVGDKNTLVKRHQFYNDVQLQNKMMFLKRQHDLETTTAYRQLFIKKIKNKNVEDNILRKRESFSMVST